jgi:hypothetical protein
MSVTFTSKKEVCRGGIRMAMGPLKIFRSIPKMCSYDSEKCVLGLT